MNRLFWKIFLWFWLATILLVVLGAWATHQVAQLSNERNLERPQATARLAARVERMRALLVGRNEIKTVDALPPRLRRGIYVVDEQGAEVWGRPLPAPVADFLAGGVTDGVGETAVLAQAVKTPDGRRLRLLAHLPRFAGPGRRAGPPRAGGGRRPKPLRAVLGPRHLRPFWWVRLTVAILVSGLVCYLLARYLARPVQSLRSATQRFAKGDLSARVGPVFGRRRDEIADLGRDFDAMAGQIEDLVQAQRRLLGDVSHELRSPLARLQVALELARKRAAGHAEAEHDRIELETERLGELIGEILALESLSNPNLEVEPEPVELGALVEAVVSDVRFEGQEVDQIVVSRAEHPCLVLGDPVQLRSAIENVVRNAVRYGPPGGEIHVRCEESADRVEIKVRDRGPGVPPEALSKLFEPFFRVDESRGRDSGGHGLGLAITARVTARHGGSASATNAPGGGLEVRLTFPRAEG